MIYWHPLSPPALATVITAKLCDADVRLRYTSFGEKNEPKSEWYRKINPNGQVPAYKEGRFTLFESRAIMNYFDNKCTQTKGTDYWKLQSELYFEMGTLTPEIMGLVLPVFRGKSTPEEALANVGQLQKVKIVLSKLDARFLSRSKGYIAGGSEAITHVDVNLIVYLAGMTLIGKIGIDMLFSFKGIQRWLIEVMACDQKFMAILKGIDSEYPSSHAERVLKILEQKVSF